MESFQQLEEEYQKTQHDLMNLMESFQAISSTLELEEVLKKIIYSASSIFKTANAGYIQLYDETTDRLLVKTYMGFNDDILNFKVKVGESITGRVFRDGIVKLIYNEKDIYGNMSDLSMKNFDYLQKAILFKQSIKSIMSVPVSFGSNRIGVMTLHCFDTEEGMSETDLLLLQSFTTQAAIALHNARLHTDVQTSLNEITSLSEKLKEANALLARRTEIHNLLTRLSVQNKGLTTILSEMNHLMDKNVVYADYLEGKHYSRDDEPFNEYLDDIFLLFTNKPEPAYVSIYDTSERWHYVYPIRSGSLFLGCLIAEGKDPLSGLDSLIMEQGAPVLSLEVVKRRSQTEIRYKKTYELYQQFLKMKNPQQAELAAKELGINHHPFHQTAFIELDGNVDLHALENDALLLLQHLKKQVPLENSLLFSYNNKITFFTTAPNAEKEEYVTEMIENSVTWWNERYQAAARAGISSGHYLLGQAEENQEKAEKALLHLRKQKRNGSLQYRDIGLSRLFIHHSPEEIEVFLNETLSLLWSDRKKHVELLDTLFTYVKNNRSVSASAKALHIHTNTLYHRINRIEEMLEADFDHYEDFLKVQLAVYLYQTFLE